MTRFINVLTLGVALLAVGSLASAQTTATPPKSTKVTAKPADAPAPKPAKVTTVVATGKIASFDSASNSLTVTTAKGDLTFALSSKAVLKDGSKAIQASALSGLTGRTAHVQYAEKDGSKTASSVHVDAAPTAKAKK